MEYRNVEKLLLPEDAVYYDQTMNRFKRPYLEPRTFWTTMGRDVAILAWGEELRQGATTTFPIGAILTLDNYLADKQEILAHQNILFFAEAISRLEETLAVPGRLEKIEYYLIGLNTDADAEYDQMLGVAATALEEANKASKNIWIWGDFPEYLLFTPKKKLVKATRKLLPFSDAFFTEKNDELERFFE